MAATLSLNELAQRSGVPIDKLREWRSCGLVGREGDDTYEASDLKRIALIRLLLRRGLDLQALASAERAEGFLSRYVDYLLPDIIGDRCSLEDAAARLGLDLDTLRKLVEAGGLDEPDQPFSQAEVEVLRGMKVIMESGLPAEALVQLVRVYAEALGRVGEAEVKLFHFYVHERLRAEGVSGHDLIAATQAARGRMLPLAEPSVLYFHRRGLSRAVREDAVMHLQEAAGLAVPGQLRLAVMFVDLSSFTSLAEVMGDQTAADVVTRFSQLVHDAAIGCDGHVTKQIGDAFMMVFPDARSAVGCALTIKGLALQEAQFPAVRAGVQCGHVLYRDGDYLGANVNVAARLADVAARHQVLVTAAVVEESSALPEVEFVPVGRHVLKGMADEVELFEARTRTGQAQSETLAPRLVDPVCGIEVRPGHALARLVFEGSEQVFCCHECLRRFVEAPERYRARIAAQDS
jgi:class 3 adenylate cyclase/YHS domain-containing protein